MKTTILILLNLLVCAGLQAQRIEVSVEANSGLFHYAGSGATATSFITEAQKNYTNNPYGNKNGFSYGGNIGVQRVSTSGFITGIQAGYEVLRSKVDINYYQPFQVYFFLAPAANTIGSYMIPVKGESFLQDQSININPYLGYRLKINKISLDLLPGIDLGFSTSSYDKGKATATNPPSGQAAPVYQTNFKRPNPPTDIRLRFGIALNYKKIAVTGSFANGLTNYNTNINGGGSSNVKSELLRFGLAYRIL